VESFRYFSVKLTWSMVPASHRELKQVQIFFSLLNCRLGFLSSWNGHNALPCLSTLMPKQSATSNMLMRVLRSWISIGYRGLMMSWFSLTVISTCSPTLNPCCSNHIPFTLSSGTIF